MTSRSILLAMLFYCGSSSGEGWPADAAADTPPLPEQATPAPETAIAEPQWQPTPSPLAYASLWDRLRDNFSIPNLDSPLVREWEQYFAARPEYLYRISERGRR